jgi:hypothetical protein
LVFDVRADREGGIAMRQDYKDRLLAELKHVVAENARDQGPIPRARRSRWETRKACAPPGYEARLRLDSAAAGREAAAVEDVDAKTRGAVSVHESDDGAFVFTIDKSKLEPDYTVVVFAVDDVPEYGQAGESVPSIQPFVVRGDYHETCNMVDGSMEGWGIQQGNRAPNQR